MKVISHDGFARESIVRETATPVHGVTCAWCGGLNKQGKLFRYASLPDDRMLTVDLSWSKPFCSVGCMRAYNS